MIFDNYPYSNFHEMNDDWIIKTLREFDAKLDEFVVMNSLTYADPILYDTGTIYPANTVVIHNDTAYVSLKTVPAGIVPSAENAAEYWLCIFPFGAMIEELVNANVDVLEAHIDEEMPLLVNAWLAAHPDVTTTVQNGSLTWLKLHPNLRHVLLDGYTEDPTPIYIENSNFEQGSLNNITGAETDSDNTCRTGFMHFNLDGLIMIRAATDFVGRMFQYHENNSFWMIPMDTIDHNWIAVKVRANAKYRFTIQSDDASVITPSDLPLSGFWYYTEDPKYVTKDTFTKSTACERINFTPGYIKTVTAGNAVNLTVLDDTATVCAAVPCVAGEIFNISGLPFNVSTKRPIMFVDGTNVCVQALVQSLAFTEEIVAPVSGTLVINLSNSAEYYAFRNKIRLALWIQFALNGLSGMLPHNYLRQLATGSTETNTAYSLPNTNGAAQSNYTTDSYAVSPGEILIASGILPASMSYRFALFYDANGKFIGFHNRADGENVYVDEPIICPPDCATVKFTHTASNVTRVYRIYADTSTRKRVTRDGDVIKICDGTYTLWMSKHGYNNLMDLQYIRKGDTNLHTTGTDWQGPYVVSANQNADGDAIAQGAAYTGGNHAYGPGGASGTPTARTVSFKVIVDGVELEDGGDLDWNDYVEINWVNRVQAWNTKKADGSGREVLEENPVWTFRPHGEVHVQNMVKSLEPITVTTYYGMQMSAGWFSRGIFIPDATRQISSVSDIYNAYGSSFDGSVINAYDANINISMAIDTAFDLGTGSCLGNAKQIHVSNTKVYFQTINNTQFAANDYFAYRGCYHFIKP